MSVVESAPRPPHDAYRFGGGGEPALQAGTIGWTVDDLRDSAVRRLWDAGRYEIINGVLTVMPPALFEGGQVVDNLKYILHDYFRPRGIRYVSSGEVEIAVDRVRVVRADGVLIVGDAIAAFEALRFPPPDTGWRRNPLTLPPTIVIEYVSRGHETHDRLTKRAWYAEFGVPNYWVVDAFGRTVECLRLVQGGYEVDAAGSGEEVLEVRAFPGLTVPLKRVWEG